MNIFERFDRWLNIVTDPLGNTFYRWKHVGIVDEYGTDAYWCPNNEPEKRYPINSDEHLYYMIKIANLSL